MSDNTERASREFFLREREGTVVDCMDLLEALADEIETGHLPPVDEGTGSTASTWLAP